MPLQVSGRYFPHYKSETQLITPHTLTVKKGWSTIRHIHPTLFEILLVLDGSLTSTLGTEEIEQNKGDILVISPMQLHGFSADATNEVSMFFIHIYTDDEELLKWFETANEGFFPSGHHLNERLTPLLNRLMVILGERNSAHTAVFLLLYTIMDELMTYFSSNGEPGRSLHYSELTYRIARAVQSFVLQQPGENTDPEATDWLESISRGIGISRRHCHRVFKQAFGMSPRAYLMILKQQEAMHLLANTSEPIESIAYKIGYENVQSFTRQFSYWTGCSPGAFRKKQEKDTRHLISLTNSANSPFH